MGADAADTSHERPCAVGRRSRWFQRFLTIPGVVDISGTYSTRSARRIRRCHGSLPIVSPRTLAARSPRRPARAAIARAKIGGTGWKWRVSRGNHRVELAPEMLPHIRCVTSRRNARSRPRSGRSSSRFSDLVPAHDTIVVVYAV